MKRRQLIHELLKEGCILLRAGARHDIHLNPSTGKKQPVPRHTEIDEALVKPIRKYLGVK
jgi:mRNA interferase HicA